MTVTVRPIVKAKELEVVLTDQYEALDLTARLDAAVATNTAGVVRSLSVHLVRSGGVANASNLLIPARAMAPGESYLCPELIGQALGPGDKMTTLASGAGLTFMASGVEIVA